MCEKKSRAIRKVGRLPRMREVRRRQRQQEQMPPSMESTPSPHPDPPVVDKNAQCRVILELAWKTISLMQKNSVIQQKIVALQQETTEFVAAIMRNPENKRRYNEHLRIYGQHPQSLVLAPVENNTKV